MEDSAWGSEERLRRKAQNVLLGAGFIGEWGILVLEGVGSLGSSGNAVLFSGRTAQNWFG